MWLTALSSSYVSVMTCWATLAKLLNFSELSRNHNIVDA